MKFFKCPCCNKLHFTRVNGLSFENPYKTLSEFTIKKRLKCGKCHNNLAIFVNNKTAKQRLFGKNITKFMMMHSRNKRIYRLKKTEF